MFLRKRQVEIQILPLRGPRLWSRQEPRPVLVLHLSFPFTEKGLCILPPQLETKKREVSFAASLQVLIIHSSLGVLRPPLTCHLVAEKNEKVQISNHVGPQCSMQRRRVALHCCKTFISGLHLDPGLINSSTGMQTTQAASSSGG